jgi:hypothetical protein
MRRLLHQQEVACVGKRLRATVHAQVHHRITVGAVARPGGLCEHGSLQVGGGAMKMFPLGTRVRVLRRDWCGTVGTVRGRGENGKVRVKISPPHFGPSCILSLELGEIEPMEPCGK